MVAAAHSSGKTTFDRFFLERIRDERDLVIIHRAAWMTATVIPLAVALFMVPTWATWLAAIPYLAFIFLRWAGRYTLMLHVVCHRPLFHATNVAWSRWIPWVLGPFVGHTPTSFYVHHIGMHHPENNLEDDLSCTMAYKRDEFSHWLHYWARFFWFGYVHLPHYFSSRGRTKLYRWLVLGEWAWFAAVAGLLWVNVSATLVVFVIPFCIMRFVMMCGNFAQHAFVDVDDPGNPFKNSTCMTNTPYNAKCYNDGYHIVHHIKPALHFTEMAQWYEDNIEEFARQDAIVFDGIRDNQQIWFFLMTKRYRALAERMVNFNDRTVEERIALLKSRVQSQRGSFPRLIHRS